MKTRAKIRNLLTAASVAAILATHCSESFAEDQKPDAKAQTAAQAAMQEYDLVISDGVLIKPDGRRADGGWKVATISVLVDALGMLYPQANIVIDPALSQASLADLKLHAHDLPEMLDAIRVASGNKFDWSGPNPPRPGTIDPATGLPAAGAVPEPNSGLYVLSPPAQKGQNERVIEAFNIGPFLDRKLAEGPPGPQANNEKNLREWRAIKTEEMVDKLQANIIETVASFKQTDENRIRTTLKFQFHSGANLLVAIGPRDDVEVVRKMMNALMTDPNGVRVDTIRSDSSDPHRDEPQPISIEVFRLKNASIGTASQTANSLLTDSRSRVIPDLRTKTIAVTATKAELITVRKAIEELDAASKPYVGDNPAVKQPAIAH